LLLLSVAAVVVGAVYVSTSRRFYVYGADITGCHHLNTEEIYRVADLNTQHILWISPERIEERLAAVPGVQTASVNRRMPAKVAIRIEEREPEIRWFAELQGREYWLDEEGVVLPYKGRAEAIVVTDTGERELVIGEQIELEGIVPAVRQITRFVPGVLSFSYDPRKGLSFVQTSAGGQWHVVVGDGQHLKLKVQAVLALTDYFAENGIQPVSVDVTRPSTAIYRPEP
jgi:cell division protein FtsQ